MNASAASASTIALRIRLLVCAAVLYGSCAATLAQAPVASSDYTKDLPSVQRVETEIKGSDLADTLARQVAVFNYLVVYIDRIKYNRVGPRGSFTPGEQKLYDAYRLAAYQLAQDYAKSHTPAEATAFDRLHGQYEMNAGFYKDWSHRLIGQQAADTYKGAEAGLAATSKEHEEKLQQQLKREQGSGRSSIAGDPVLDPMGIFARGQANMENDPAVRRCLELGGTIDECEGVNAIESMASLLVPSFGKSDSNEPAPLAGVVFVGTYHSRSALPSLTFGGGGATLQDCGSLVPDDHNYVLRKAGAAVQFAFDNEPEPFTVSMRPDGTLSGPGSVLVKGRIITGYTTTTSQVMVNGAPAAAQGYSCNGACSTTTSVPNYAPKIERCTIGSMDFVPPKPVAPLKSGIGFLDALSSSKPLATGLRMSGRYAGASGLALEFNNDSVILDCGKAHVNAPYAVDNTPNGFVVHVQNGGGAFLLAVAPDNTLRGSGATIVNGRLVSAIHDDNVSFTPHSESCSVGTLVAKSKRNTMVASRGPTPSLPASYSATSLARATEPAPATRSPSAALEASGASAGISSAPSGTRAQLRVLLSSNFSGTNPLIGQTVFVMRKPINQILQELGVAVPDKATPGRAMKALQIQCHSSEGCRTVIQGLTKYYVTTTKLDASGRATLSATAATGPYYFFAVVPDSGGSLVWDVAANLAAGDNAVALNQANVEHLQ